MKSMTTLRIPTPLRPYAGGKSEVAVGGSNVAEALNDLTTQFPAIKPHIFSEGGELRPFVNLFLGESNIKDLEGIATPIKETDRLMLIPSIAGGCHCEEGAARRSNLLYRGRDCFAPAGLAMTLRNP